MPTMNIIAFPHLQEMNCDMGMFKMKRLASSENVVID